MEELEPVTELGDPDEKVKTSTGALFRLVWLVTFNSSPVVPSVPVA